MRTKDEIKKEYERWLSVTGEAKDSETLHGELREMDAAAIEDAFSATLLLVQADCAASLEPGQIA